MEVKKGGIREYTGRTGVEMYAAVAHCCPHVKVGRPPQLLGVPVASSLVAEAEATTVMVEREPIYKFLPQLAYAVVLSPPFHGQAVRVVVVIVVVKR